MILPRVSPVAAIVLPILTIARARECVFGDPGSDDEELTSLEQAHERLNGCTTIVGSVRLSSEYTGNFSLPGVTNITGSLSCSYLTGVDVLEMPDLLYVGSLWLVKGGIRRLDLPQLKTVDGWIRMDDAVNDVAVNLPNLTTAESLWLWPRFSSLNVDSLETVPIEIVIGFCSGCDINDPSMPDTYPELTFSALKHAGFVDLSGMLSSAHFQSLVSAGPPTGYNEFPDDTGIRIRTEGTGTELSFTSLEDVDYHFIINWCYFKVNYANSLSLPSLNSTSASMTIRTSTPLTLDLPIEKHGWIELGGNIQNASFPNLKQTLPAVSIDGLNCTALGEGLGNTQYYKDNCAEDEQGLSTGGKVAVGVVVPVCVAVIILAGVIWYRRRARRGKGVVDGSELVDIRGPAMGSTNEVANAQDTHIPNGILRTQTPPPPYEPRSQ